MAGNGLSLANKLASSIDKYHQTKQALGSNKSKATSTLEENDTGPDTEGGRPDETTHHTDMEQLEDVLCPGCHTKLREHLVSKASGSGE